MDFTSIGSMHNYINTTKMQQKWKLKKSNGNFKADGTKSIGEWIEKQQKKNSSNPFNITRNEDTTDKMLQDINNKLAVGKKLTLEEREYLRQKNPQLYRQLEQQEAEEKQYKEDLKHCKTKEDVQKLKMSKVAASLSVVNSVKNNPNIPEGAKLGLIAAEQQKMRAIEEATVKFVQSERYAKLPTEAEKAEAERILQEAEEERLDLEQNDREEVSADMPTKEAAQMEASSDENEKAVDFSAGKDIDKTVEKDPESSPEVRKLKRAEKEYNGRITETENASAGIIFEFKV